MTAYPGLGITGNGVGVTTPLSHKLAQSGLIAKTGAGTNTIRPGVFYDGVSNIVTGTDNMSYNVAAFTAALSRGGSSGTVLLANDGTVNVATTAAPGSNSRIDTVYVWQREFSLDGVNSNPVIGVAQGTAAAFPVAPSLAAFPGALELARITVPAGVTATNTGTTITQTAPFTAPAGGEVVFRNATERNAATLVAGTSALLLSDGTRHFSTGSGWVPVAEPGLVPVAPASVAGTGVVAGAGGLVTFTAATAVSLNGCFTSSYRNYKVLIEVTSRSAASFSTLLYRSAGTNLVTGYDANRVIWAAAGSSGQLANNPDIPLASGNFPKQNYEVELRMPQLSQQSGYSARIVEFQAAGAPTIVTVDGSTRSTAAQDGFTFSATAGTMTGTLKVYGYN